MSVGTRGPVPKRDEERRRRSEPGDAVEKTDISDFPVIQIPAADENWHRIAHDWFESLKSSGQSLFYEPSDWAVALLLAESMSRDLKPQFVGVSETEGAIFSTIPLKGASLAAYLKGFSVLMVTEGDRRRARMELERNTGDVKAPASVTSLADKRRALLG